MIKPRHEVSPSGIHYYIYPHSDKQRETIVFLHPAFADHHCFDAQIDCFTKNYTVITLDLIGHGRSQIKGTKDTIIDTGRHLVEILNQENIEKVHLAGVSIGSYLGQHFCNHYPERVLSLTSLGGCNINHYDTSIEKEQRKQQVAFMLKAVFSIKAFSQSNAAVSAYTKKAQSDFYTMNCKFKRRSFIYLSTLGKIMNQYPGELNFPLLILYGEFDNNLAIALSRKWKEEQPTSQLVKLNHAGHCANMDTPERYNQTLLDFLGGLPIPQESATLASSK